MGVFKAVDEEPYAPNNPRGPKYQAKYGQESTRPGVLSGEISIREVAAYLLDHDNFSQVPPTTFVEVLHPNLQYRGFDKRDVDESHFKEIMKSLIRPVNEQSL